MTATHTQPGLIESAQQRSSDRLPASAALRLRWEIRATALIAAPKSAAMLNGHAAKLDRARLEWRLTPAGHGFTATCILVLEMRGGNEDAMVLLDNTPVTVMRDGPFEHIESPGRFTCTIRTSTGRLAFARTSVLQDALGLPGGVYEAPTLIGA